MLPGQIHRVPSYRRQPSKQEQPGEQQQQQEKEHREKEQEGVKQENSEQIQQQQKENSEKQLATDEKKPQQQQKQQLPSPLKIHYDEVYNYIGQLGFYQKCVAAMIMGFTLFALDAVTMIFVAADMPHFCRVPHLSNLSYALQKYIAVPYVSTDLELTALDSLESVEVVYESCRMYELNYSQYSESELVNWNRSVMVDDSTPLIKCDSWIFEQTIFVSTIISRFELVCGAEFFNQLASMLYMIGAILGGVGAGGLSDKIGRMPSLIIFLGIKMVGAVASTFSSVYEGFAAGRFLLGVGSSACFIIAYVLLMEIVGPEYRAKAGCSMQVGTSIGFMVQPLVAWCVRDDVKYQIASLMPNVIIFLFIFIVPESPRWLLVTGRLDKADRVFRDMCEVNRTVLPQQFDVHNIEKDEEEQGSYMVLLKSPIMRTRTIAMNIIWFFCNLTYFALALNVGYLPGDIYVNTIISAGLEVPAIILCAFLLDRPALGRRWSSVLAFTFTTVCIALCIPMELANIGMAVTILNVIGKALNVVGYSIMYVYASEIFPTEVRNSAMGVSQMFACIGSVISPYVGEPLAKIWRPLPYIILGSCSLLTVLLSLLEPETYGKPLCDTIQQAERLATHDLLCNDKTSRSSSAAEIVDSTASSATNDCKDDVTKIENESETTSIKSDDAIKTGAEVTADTTDVIAESDIVIVAKDDVINGHNGVLRLRRDVIKVNKNVTNIEDEVTVVESQVREGICRRISRVSGGQTNEAYEADAMDIGEGKDYKSSAFVTVPSNTTKF